MPTYSETLAKLQKGVGTPGGFATVEEWKKEREKLLAAARAGDTQALAAVGPTAPKQQPVKRLQRLPTPTEAARIQTQAPIRTQEVRAPQLTDEEREILQGIMSRIQEPLGAWTPQVPEDTRGQEVWDAIRNLLSTVGQQQEFNWQMQPFTPEPIQPIDVEAVRQQIEGLLRPSMETAAQRIREEEQLRQAQFFESLGRRGLLYSPSGAYQEQLAQQQLGQRLTELEAAGLSNIANMLVPLIQEAGQQQLAGRQQLYQEWLASQQLGLEAAQARAALSGEALNRLLQATGLAAQTGTTMRGQEIDLARLGLQARQAQEEALARYMGLGTETARSLRDQQLQAAIENARNLLTAQQLEHEYGWRWGELAERLGLEREQMSQQESQFARQLGLQERLGLADVGLRGRELDIREMLGLGELGLRGQELNLQERQFVASNQARLDEMALRWAELAQRKDLAEADRELQRELAKMNLDVAKERTALDWVVAQGQELNRWEASLKSIAQDLKTSGASLADVEAIFDSQYRPQMEMYGFSKSVIDAQREKFLSEAKKAGIKEAAEGGQTSGWIPSYWDWWRRGGLAAPLQQYVLGNWFPQLQPSQGTVRASLRPR